MRRFAIQRHRAREYNEPDAMEIIDEAERISRDPKYASLSDAELIRLVYWGASGTPEKGDAP